ncbi:NAD-dependent epimerase/dehydratase [Mycena metata]|uniref:NAD-dependent epimerase/dehydratase n=1 Tax=Mycena metata TaxID=1033252 RepID=A0AAD7P1G8_9AGAR|nr:NAD-dependent epimerase/dehydratase [Mycena metata]
MIPATDDLILVTGGNGFIGSHLVQRFLARDNRVRVVDIAAKSSLEIEPCPRLEILVGSLLEKRVCFAAVKGVHTVLHLAANMGGMGAIHCDNDFKIYEENHNMTLNLLPAAAAAGVKQFLYASSACVYPESLQDSSENDVSLREGDVWKNPLGTQGLYGLEKLTTEMLLAQQKSPMTVFIPRFHNVYGPGGAWNNGREKAPAAMLRKAIATKLLDSTSPSPFEIWGDGKQRRSFLWIGDCVDAVLRLLASDCSDPVNVGSAAAVSIETLAEIALKSAGTNAERVRFEYDGSDDKLVGVQSRNSNNEFSKQVLNWEPKTPLEVGMRHTGEWIESQMGKVLDIRGVEAARLKESFLTRCLKSKIINFSSGEPIFAILLPVTSRGSSNENDCLANLASFCASLVRTTLDEVFSNDPPFRLRVYVAIDEDDKFLLEGNKVETILRQHGIPEVDTSICSFPRGHVCSLWRHLARRAWEDGCTYFTLMGDDVILEDAGWMGRFHATFAEMAHAQGVPLGFGCVAFTDSTFGGMPTFPIVHRTHMDIFNGTVVPEEFVNQDGDPYLFQLYRRFGSSTMIESKLRNLVGGSNDARYEKIHAPRWTFKTLSDGVSTAENWLRKQGNSVEQKLTLDVIIPCYRVHLDLLRRVLALESSPTCSVSIIVIIDNPQSSNIAELQKEYGSRPDVRIRVNSLNMGASFSRNRGLAEATAKWVLFLDDDVQVDKHLLLEAEHVIRSHPKAAGFVGLSEFPPANGIFSAAIHLSGVTWFWDIAKKLESDLPWGVTANLISRRDVADDVKFDLSFPKTGGGEDIDFCRQKRAASIAVGNCGFLPAPRVRVIHPWWSNGKRSYWRFYMWGQGDGGLIRKYPGLTYRDFPNSAELFLGGIIVTAIGVVSGFAKGSWGIFYLGLKCCVAVIVANIAHDSYRHLWRDVDRTLFFETEVVGVRWATAVMESALLRMASEGGRVVGILKRGEISLLPGKRFDWFAGTMPGAINEERRNSFQRICLFLFILTIVL